MAGVTPLLSEPSELLALGVFVGALVAVIVFGMTKAAQYGERAYLLHAAATMMAVLAIQSHIGRQLLPPQVVMAFVMAVAGMQLRDLIAHAGGLLHTRRWLVGVSVVLLPLLALASYWEPLVLLAAAAAWLVVAYVVVWQAWRQSRPWGWWVLPGIAALAAGSALLAWTMHLGEQSETVGLPVAALVMVWSACVYLATDWRERLVGETRARVNARNTLDPLTGLSMPIVLYERMHGARTMMRRYGHPTVLLLVHIENLTRLAAEFGPEASESVLLTAANRVRQAVRDGDVTARVTHSRIAVLAEGLSTTEAASNIASRILVAGLKEPVPALPAEFLQFRIVMAAIPRDDVQPKAMLQRLNARLEQELYGSTERRIATLAPEELTATANATATA